MRRLVRSKYFLYTLAVIIVLQSLSFTLEKSYQHFDSNVRALNTSQQSRTVLYSSRCNVTLNKSDDLFLETLFKKDNTFNYLSYVLPSHSFFYCSVPKVGTRTILLFLTYLHIRDELMPLLRQGNQSNLFNVQRLNKTILSIFKNESQPNSAALLNKFLSYLSDSPKMDIWPLHYTQVFPLIRPRNLLNLSSIISQPNSIRAMFVRHPLERFASAYTDKIASLTQPPFFYYDKVRRIICRKYSSFYLTKEQQDLYRTNPQIEKEINEPCGKIQPKFEHFIEYMMVNPIREDVHWKPYSRLCQACLFNYNFIGKFEQMNENLIKLVQYFRLDVSQWIHDDYFRTGKSKSNYQMMYSNLDEKYLCYLKNFYKDDLKLFDYQFEEYFSLNRTLQCPS